MRNNVDKWYFLVSSNEKVAIKYALLTFLKRKKFLVVHPDSGLSSDYHKSEFCKKASRKICAPARVTLSKSLLKTRPYECVFEVTV